MKVRELYDLIWGITILSLKLVVFLVIEVSSIFS